MKKPCFLLILLLIFGTNAAPALADSFGDMIAENLCVNPRATLTLSDADSALYDNSGTISGKCNFTSGINTGTSTFSKSVANAFCMKKINPKMGTDVSPPTMGTVEQWLITKEGKLLKRSNR